MVEIMHPGVKLSRRSQKLGGREDRQASGLGAALRGLEHLPTLSGGVRLKTCRPDGLSEAS